MNKSYELIVEILESRFEIDPAELRPDASFEDISLDSLSQIELATAVRKKYGLHISDDEMAEITGIAEIVTRLEAHFDKNGVTA